MTLLSFAACVIVAKMIADGEVIVTEPRPICRNLLFITIGAILTFMNLTVLKERSINEYIRGKKFLKLVFSWQVFQQLCSDF